MCLHFFNSVVRANSKLDYFEQTCTVTIFGEHGIITHIPLMAKPIRAVELHYPMIQFLIKVVMSQNKHQCAQKVQLGDQILKISHGTLVFN